MLVRDLTPGPAHSYPADVTNVDGTLFFRATPQLNGGQLWRTDGSEAGTVLLKSFSGFFQVANLAAVGGRLVFTADDDTSGAEPWVSDGTPEGTILLADIAPGADDSFPAEFIAMDGALFFSAGKALWKTDGTGAGTALVAHIPDLGDRYCLAPFQLLVVGHSLFFRSCRDGFGTDLWTSDGTTGGTMRLGQITTGPVIDRTFAIKDDLLIFPGADIDHGLELWRSDGTPAGTGLLKDINPGTSDSDPAFLRTVNGRVVFTACDSYGVSCTPWITDGTESGTRQIADVASSGPLEPAGPLLFFAGSDRLRGDELWAIPLAAIAPCQDCSPTPTSTADATGSAAPTASATPSMTATPCHHCYTPPPDATATPMATATPSVIAAGSPTQQPLSTAPEGGGGCSTTTTEHGSGAGWLLVLLLTLRFLRRRYGSQSVAAASDPRPSRPLRVSAVKIR